MQEVRTFRGFTRPSRACRATLLAVVLVGGGLLTLPAMAQQSGTSNSGTTDAGSQSSSAQSKQQNQPPAHKSPAPKSSPAQENPFPADVSEHAAQQQQQGQPGDPPAAPGADQQPSRKPGDAATENPFPEDVSKSAAAAAAKDNDASGSSSSSSSSSNAGGDTDPNVDPNADLPRDTGRRRLKKPSDKDIQSGSLAGQGEAQDDVRVGRYYLGTRDYKGAYGRFSEATRLDPTNVEAIYGLAAAAAGLHHTDEALANYKLYLQVAPDGNNAKSARKAIQSLSK